jgi:phage I-like protein
MTPILSTAAKLPEDGFYQIAALGEHPIVIGDDAAPVRIVQVVDAAACEAMANRFAQERAARPAAELLVDYDHFSEDTDKTSEAAGWIQELQNRADGLYARIQWTDNGEAAVRGRRYRFLSPVWNRSECEVIAAGRVRPMRLDRAAVTNDPNIKGMAPLINRTAPIVAAAPADSGSESPATGGKESKMDYKAELLAMLGLNAEATDEEISAAVAAKKAKDAETAGAVAERDAISNRAQAAEAKVAEFETAALAAQV